MLKEEYILRETKGNGDCKEYSFDTYEEAKAALKEKADADQASLTHSSDIQYFEDSYNRFTYETNDSYNLKIEGLNTPKPSWGSISF